MSIKALKSLAVAITVAVFAVCASPSLAQNITRTVSISREAKLGGQAISQGKYAIIFDEKKEGEATVLKGGKEILKTSYKLVELKGDASDNAVIFTAASDGSLQIRRIELKGSKIALLFE